MTMAAPTSKDSFAFGGEVYIIYGSSVGQLVVTLPFSSGEATNPETKQLQVQGQGTWCCWQAISAKARTPISAEAVTPEL